MCTNRISYLGGWLLLLCTLPYPAHSATPVQFIDGLWLDKEPLYAEETARIYVALRNSAPVAISGEIAITIDGERQTTRSIAALPGRLIESWVDWTPPAAGDYRITATLEDVTLEHPTGPETLANPTATLTREAVTVIAPPSPSTTTPHTDATHNTSTTTAPSVTDRPSLPQWYQTLTNQIQQTHKQLQAYERSLVQRQGTTTPSTTTATTTTTSAIPLSVSRETLNTSTTTAGATLRDVATTWLATNLQNAQLWLVRSIRWLFGYPVLVQLLLLLGILGASYRIARYFGKR